MSFRERNMTPRELTLRDPPSTIFQFLAKLRFRACVAVCATPPPCPTWPWFASCISMVWVTCMLLPLHQDRPLQCSTSAIGQFTRHHHCVNLGCVFAAIRLCNAKEGRNRKEGTRNKQQGTREGTGTGTRNRNTPDKCRHFGCKPLRAFLQRS